MKQFRLVIIVDGLEVKGSWLNQADWTIQKLLSHLTFTEDYYFEFR